MPIYEYSCSQCANQFEEIVLGREEDVPCPKCGSKQTHKLMSRCRTKIGGTPDLGQAAAAASRGGCSGCGGGSCASCG